MLKDMKSRIFRIPRLKNSRHPFIPFWHTSQTSISRKIHLSLVQPASLDQAPSVTSSKPTQPRSLVISLIFSWSEVRSRQTTNSEHPRSWPPESSRRDMSLCGTSVLALYYRDSIATYPCLRSLPTTVLSKKTNRALLPFFSAINPLKRTPPA